MLHKACSQRRTKVYEAHGIKSGRSVTSKLEDDHALFQPRSMRYGASKAPQARRRPRVQTPQSDGEEPVKVRVKA